MVNIFFTIFILSVSAQILVNQGDLLRKSRSFSKISSNANQRNSTELQHRSTMKLTATATPGGVVAASSGS
jgi:hypothetical protein